MKRYEYGIRVLTTFFAFLGGLGLKNIIDGPMSRRDPATTSQSQSATGGQAQGNAQPQSDNPVHPGLPDDDRWLCFVLNMLLYLRFLLGSANHMWYEYVRTDRDTQHGHVAKAWHIGKDFLFLLVFGCIGVFTGYSGSVKLLLIGNLVLTQ